MRIALLVAAILVSGVVAGLWRPGRSQNTREQAAAASVPSPAGTVRLSDAQWASLEIRAAAPGAFRIVAVADAVISPDERLTVPVYSPASGRVTEVEVELGQEVRRGQALARISGMETAQAVSELAAATAQDRTAQRLLELSQEVAARQAAVVAAGGGAAKDWHQSQADLIAAEGARRIAEATLAAARVKVAAVGVDLPASGGVMLAPIDGLILQRQLAAGQFINSLASGGQTPLFTISDLRHVWVVGSLPEGEAAALRLGQPVEISLSALSAQPVKSVVSWISPTIDPQTRQVQFRAQLDNPDRALKPQMTARIKVLSATDSSGLAIPSTAIIRDGDKAHCYVATASRTLTLRQLRIGRTQDGLTEVTSGLQPGERVVTRGAIFVDTLSQGAES